MGLILSAHRDIFSDFSRQLLETKDIDPQYYSLRGVSDLRGYTIQDRYEFCCIYYGFNHIASADRFFEDRTIDPILLSYGKNRRGFRGNRKVLEFINGALHLRPLILKLRTWEQIYESFLLVRGCGPWSAYCLTETMKIVVGLPITAPDFGTVKSSKNKTGPIAGLELLTGIPMARLSDPRLHQEVYLESLERVDWNGKEEMESALCNYMSLVKKTYYVGRDIDRQIPALQSARKEWWQAREIYFPYALLGEKNGWSGPRKELMGTFEMLKVWKKYGHSSHR